MRGMPQPSGSRSDHDREAAASALHHRDVHALDLALGADLDGLLVAIGLQGQAGGKSGGLDEPLDPATAGGALQTAVHIAAGFAPVARNPVALARDIAAQVEFVAVAGAMQALLEAEARAVDFVVGPAADALGGAVGESHRAVSGPGAAKAGKRARLGMARRHRQHEDGADAGRLDRLPKQAGAKQFHSRFPQIDVPMKDTSPPIEDLVSP